MKTVLLAEVSPRLKQGGLTIERLVQLNAVDVEGETFRGQVRVAETDLLALSQRVPDLQVAGQGKTALVRYVLGRVSLGEILGRARSKVDNPAQRFKVFWGALKRARRSTGMKGFEEGGANEGDWDLEWRRTRRRGRIKLGNVREMSYDDFEPPEGAFKVLVDYPWDEPGHTVDEDRLRATNVRKKQGPLAHGLLAPASHEPDGARRADRARSRPLPALRGRAGGPARDARAAGPRARFSTKPSIRQKTLEGQLDDLLSEVYVRHGEFFALISDVDSQPPARNAEREPRAHRDAADGPSLPAAPDLPRRAEEAGPRGAARLDGRRWRGQCLGRVRRGRRQGAEDAGAAARAGEPRADQGLAASRLPLHQGRPAARRPGFGRMDADRGSPARDLWIPATTRSISSSASSASATTGALQEVDGEPVEARIGMPPAIRIRLAARQARKCGRLAPAARSRQPSLHAPRPASASLSAGRRTALRLALERSGQEKRIVLQQGFTNALSISAWNKAIGSRAFDGEHPPCAARADDH